MTEHCRRRGGGFQPLVSSMDERENWQIVLEREGMSFRRSLTFVFLGEGGGGSPPNFIGASCRLNKTSGSAVLQPKLTQHSQVLCELTFDLS